jgi:hypothetical protein
MSVEGTDAPHRQLEVARFQNEPECTLFVESLELTDWRFDLTVVSHVVFAEQDWVPGRMAEAEDRCFKVAQQKEGLTIQMLVFAGSLDLKRCMAMSGTRQVVTLQAT